MTRPPIQPLVTKKVPDTFSRAFSRTHTSFAPWIIVQANNKRKARLESMRHVLSLIDYDGKKKARVSLCPDPNIITRYHRNASKVD